MNEYVNAIYNQRNPNALKELLEKKKKDLDEALLTVITDMDMATDEKIKNAKLLFRAGADPNVQTPEKEPVLNFCINQTELRMVELLVRCKVDVNAVDQTGKGCLHLCAEKGLLELAKKLLAAGANPNLQDESGWIPLFDAMIEKSWEMFKLLLAVSDLSLTTVNNETAFHILVEYRDRPLAYRALTRFIEEGIDLNVCSKEKKCTALVEAAMYRHWDLFEILVKAGCDLNTEVDDGRTILEALIYISADYEDEEIEKMVQFLIKAGADVDGIDPAFSSPLNFAITVQNLAIVKQLLQANSSGRLPKYVINDARVDFMRHAVENDASEAAKFIFGDACSSGENQDFQEQFYHMSLTAEASVDGQTIGLSKPPVSLYRLCRLAIRSTLPKGPKFSAAVDELPLSKHVKGFVAMHPYRN